MKEFRDIEFVGDQELMRRADAFGMGANAAVPEPATWVLVAFAFAAVAFRRIR